MVGATTAQIMDVARHTERRRRACVKDGRDLRDPLCMVRGVPSRAAPELLRPGGARAARSPRALVVVFLRALSRLDDTRDGRAGQIFNLVVNAMLA